MGALHVSDTGLERRGRLQFCSAGRNEHARRGRAMQVIATNTVATCKNVIVCDDDDVDWLHTVSQKNKTPNSCP